MGYKVQFNPSTGKVGYTSATGKVQVVADVVPVDPCSFCVVNSPDQIEVTLSDFVVSCCAGTGGSSGKSRVWDTAIESIVNGVHILDHVSQCEWQKEFVIDVDILDYESASDCTGTPVLRNYTSIVMSYTVSNPFPDDNCTIRLQLVARGDGVSVNTIISAGVTSEILCDEVLTSNCLPVDPLVAGSGCDYFGGVSVIDGTIDIVEVV